jgi:hypothetical protein
LQKKDAAWKLPVIRDRRVEQDHGNVSFLGEGSSAEKDIVGLPGSQRAAEHIEKFAARHITEWALEYKCVIRGRNELVNRRWGLFLHDKTRLSVLREIADPRDKWNRKLLKGRKVRLQNVTIDEIFRILAKKNRCRVQEDDCDSVVGRGQAESDPERLNRTMGLPRIFLDDNNGRECHKT